MVLVMVIMVAIVVLVMVIMVARTKLCGNRGEERKRGNGGKF